jgi:DNA mismatch repair protein MutS
MRQWVNQPLLNVQEIEQRQDGVEFFFKHAMPRAELRAALKHLADLERLTNRIISGHAQPRDLVSLRATLQRIPEILKILPKKTSASLPTSLLEPCSEELSLLGSAIPDDPPATLQNTGIIRPGHSSELDGVVEASRHAREWINNLESVERERTGIKSLKVGYNKVFGYYIEISHANTGLAPKEYIRKQTLVNAERYITPEMKEYETLVLNAEERIREIELRLFREVCATLSNSAKRLLDSSHAIAGLDVRSALAESAALGGYVRPRVRESEILDIREGRHPVLETLIYLICKLQGIKAISMPSARPAVTQVCRHSSK